MYGNLQLDACLLTFESHGEDTWLHWCELFFLDTLRICFHSRYKGLWVTACPFQFFIAISRIHRIARTQCSIQNSSVTYFHCYSILIFILKGDGGGWLDDIDEETTLTITIVFDIDHVKSKVATLNWCLSYEFVIFHLIVLF